MEIITLDERLAMVTFFTISLCLVFVGGMIGIFHYHISIWRRDNLIFCSRCKKHKNSIQRLKVGGHSTDFHLCHECANNCIIEEQESDWACILFQLSRRYLNDAIIAPFWPSNKNGSPMSIKNIMDKVVYGQKG